MRKEEGEESVAEQLEVQSARFEDLRVWQAARELAKGVYRACRTQKVRSDRVMVDQMTRAAVSVVSNIAEGHERGSRAQNMEFCYYAKGSVGELRSQLILARDVELLDDRAYQWLHGKSEEVGNMLGRYLAYMKANPRIRKHSGSEAVGKGRRGSRRTSKE